MTSGNTQTGDITENIRKLLSTNLSTKDFEDLLKNVIGEKLLQSSSEKEIKQLLTNSGILEKISKALEERRTDQTDETIQIIKGNVAVESIDNDIKPECEPAQPKVAALDLFSNKTPPFKFDPSKQYLTVKLGKGRAFLGDSEISEDAYSSLTVHLKFSNTRFSSSPVNCCTDPRFDEFWVVEMPSTDLMSLLDIQEKLHIVVTRSNNKNQKELVGTRSLEWRQVLGSGKASKIVDINNINNPNITVGLLEIGIALAPQINSPTPSNLLMEQEIELQLRKEMKYRQETDRIFFGYAKKWWNDFLQIRPEFDERFVKIFASTEGGGWVSGSDYNGDRKESGGRKEVITNFVHCFKCKSIDTPKHAARFVSLIPFEKAENIGESRLDIWKDTHSFLSLGKGDVQDHCLLLCGLFLGFSLDAYIVCGLDKKNCAHMWVMTKRENSVVFWESLTGQRFLPKVKQSEEPKQNIHQYRSIGCIFNDKKIYANIQISDSVETCDFNFEDEQKWKQISSNALSTVKRNQSGTPFFPFLKTRASIPDQDIELSIKQHIQAYREDHGFKGSTVWDDDEMGFVLSQVLWEYEMANIWNGPGSKVLVAGMEEDHFKMGIKNCIPEGHTFKGYPINFNHQDLSKIFSTLLKNNSCRDIILTRGDKVRFSIKVKSFEYIEEVKSVWVMLSVRFRSI